MRITASRHQRIQRITIVARIARPNLERRQIAGTLFRYGEPGQTSAGELRVDDPGAIRIPANLSDVTLTRDHDRGAVRGHLAVVDDNAERLYVVNQVADGPEGDAALADAGMDPTTGELTGTRTRAALSFDLENAEVIDGVIVGADLIAIGQVPEPAFNSARIDQIAASRVTGASRPNTQGDSMTPEQRARLAELRDKQTRTPEEEAEFQQLAALALDEATATQAEENGGEEGGEEGGDEGGEEGAGAPEPDAVAAAIGTLAQALAPRGRVAAAAAVPAVPGGVPLNPVRAGVRTQPRAGGRSAFQAMVAGLAEAFRVKRRGGDPMPGITAALNDVVSTGITEDVEPLAWSGELFSGVDYQPLFSDLLTPGELTNWEGKGWRFTQTPEMADYAGDKAAIPSGSVGTEESLWEAARAAVGVDIDRKFFDFPNEAFLTGLFQAMAGSWEIVKDTKSRLFIATEAVSATRAIAVHTTNADATVTAAAGTFAASDVGAKITGAGIPAGATILTFTNSGSIELSANATATANITATMDVQAPTVLKAAARASMSLNKRSGQSKAPSSTGADWIVLNEEDHFGLLDINEQAVPAFLDLYGIDPKNFRSSPDVPPGEVWAGVRKAATLRTEGRSPIAVDALNLANGGIDKAFFGYWAIEQHHLRGIQKTKIVPV